MPKLFSKLEREGVETGDSKSLKALAAGMSLVELLVAMAILAVGITGILMLQTQTIQAGAMATGRNTATFLAESQSEWLRTLEINRVEFISPDPEHLTSSGRLCADAPTEPCLYTRTTTVVKGVPTTTSYAVSIKVEWQNRQIVYDTVVSGVGFF